MAIIERDELQSKIHKGEIKAVCVDTSVYEAQHFAFHRGLLGEMKNLPAAGIQVLLPDVIEREILSHMSEKLPEIHSALRKAMRAAGNFGLIAEDAEAKLQVPEQDFKKLANDRLQRHVDDIDACILPVGEYADTNQVFDSYFKAIAPFESKKKSEFPDAFSLSAIERWAESEDTQVVVISNDDGWANFAKDNERIHAGPRLGDLLVAIQIADPILLKKAVAAIKGPEIDSIKIRLNERINSMAINANVDSYHYAEADVLDSRVLDVDLGSLDPDDLEIVRSDGQEFVVRWIVHVRVRFEASVQLSVYDSIDKDYVPLSVEDVSRDDDLELESLLSFSIENDDDAINLEFQDIELTDSYIDIDLGEVEISHDQE
ncbi:DUF4935 domain-containing protein [Luteibacter flocculans]|uniref:DUF4935 domain-containing protein n=1 Tax=Luteibacter flocculans TaxID=2780091 RepID=A0ABY4SWD2_9GAMM|nr:PIN domain-containing protein [Luteibacter flocculans]URL57017.1 DUF4935 domain-containing protein [Luteibacter flocculans]